MEKNSIDFQVDENYEVDFELKEHNNTKKSKIIKVLIVIFIIFGSIICYSRYVGTTGLKVIENKIEDSNLPSSFEGFKIVQFADIHYGMTTSLKDIKRVIKEINKLRPDIVVFTGDLFDTDINISENDVNVLKEELKKIDASINKYAVKGNEDYNYLTEYETIFKYADFTILDNSNELVYYKEKTPIKISGITSTLKKEDNLNDALTVIDDEENYYTILLSHEPIIMNHLDGNKVNVILSSHSLGGLINIPFVGGIIKQKGAESYVSGLYEYNNKTKMYVSTGIGTHKYNFRLFNRPSINLYRLYK